MKQLDWFTKKLDYEDYKDLQNTLHYYALTHMELVGHRLLQGVDQLDDRLNNIQYDEMECSEAMSQLIELDTEFEQLMTTSYKSLFSFYRSIYYFHGGTIEIEVEELLKNTDSKFPELSVEMFRKKNLSDDSMRLIEMLLEEQTAIRARLLMTINQLQHLEKVFLDEVEGNCAVDHPTIEQLVSDVKKLLGRDVYQEIYQNVVELAETVIPTIPMPSETTFISQLSARIINHADYLAMVLEKIGEDVTLPRSTECIMGKWIEKNRSAYDQLLTYHQLIKRHDDFHEAAQVLVDEGSQEALRHMLELSSLVLTGFIELVIEYKEQT
ncbi:CZB domain-containing protein [Kurthia massiliensis]|uniref:CZB domain-containing protein n=1 Tax=Kurthia massiliensis TaxID=1033739 RepID=UPI000289A3EA|nr:CZB domain-containing protein [Kurthia massiliensis]